MVDEISQILEQRDKQEKKKLERKQKTKVKLSKKELQIIELANNTVLPEHYQVVWEEEQLEEMCEFFKRQEYIAVDTETMGVNPFIHEIVGFSMYAPHKGYYVPLKHRDDIRFTGAPLLEGMVVGVDYVKCLPKELVIQKIKPILEDRNKKLILHNAKFDMHVFRIWMGINIVPYFDTMIAQWLLDENQSKALKDIAPLYLKIEADKFSTLFGNVTFDKVPILLNPVTRTGCLAGYYAIKDTELTYKMYEFQMSHLTKPYLKDIYNLMFEIEMPFIPIVAEAEARGVKFDAEYMEKEVSPQLHQQLEEIQQKIYSYTGEINLNSPKQVAEALYNKLKLPQLNSKKPDSTDKKTLTKLKKYHEVASLLLEYRALAKLIDAFVDKLPKTAINGRIHTNFATIGAVTGRMSSSDPNLQQIPSKIGNLIRNAFVADEGRLLASIDFSSQELRILTHITKDPVLMDIYLNDKDVHSMTGVTIYNRLYNDNVTYEYFQYCRSLQDYFLNADGEIDEEKFNDEYLKSLYEQGIINSLNKEVIRKDVENGIKFEKVRKNYAKSTNFGVVYGITEKGLADNIGVSEEEAKSFITGFFETYKSVKTWIKETEKQILEKGYVTTLLGRKRRLYPYLQSGDTWKIQSAFRMGCNFQIQGTAADMTKLASIKLQPLLKELDAHIVLFVHDELIFDVPENIGMENLQRIADVMCNALPLDCGMKSDIEAGKKWGQKMSKEELEELFDESEEY